VGSTGYTSVFHVLGVKESPGNQELKGGVKLSGIQPPKTRGTGFRPDIQGLRAVAVLLVVADHFFGIPQGGFVGVDVFFAISGYLITGQLVREYQKHGWIHLPSFYARRMRRIVPVAVVVAVVVICVSYAVWYVPRAVATTLDGLAATLWVANWHFAGLNTDYLNASGPVSPFQHYWSLSVEEQFYLLWPLLLMVVPFLTRRLGKISTPNSILIAVAIVTIASFSWSVYESASRPAFAYFDTIGRAWEFGLGALVGMTPLVSLTSRFVMRIVPALGLGCIIAAAFLLSPTSTFPGPWALLPVGGTLAVIWGNQSRMGLGMTALTNPAMVFIGKISFSLYLWHFPVVIFAQALVPAPTLLSNASCVAVTLLLSVASFKWVEEPIRHSKWLQSWEGGTPSRPTRSRRIGQIATSIGIAGLIGILAMTQITGFAPLKDQTYWLGLVNPAMPSHAPVVFSSDADIHVAIESGVRGDSGSTALIPELNQLTDGQQAPAMHECRNSVGTAKPTQCVYGLANAPKSALILGDSVAMSWVPTIVGALGTKSWNVRAIGFASCPPYDVDIPPRIRTADSESKCAAAKEYMIKEALRTQPDLVFLSGAHGVLASGASGDVARDEYSQGVARTLEKVALSGARILILPTPPQVADIRACADRINGLLKCTASMRQLDAPLFGGEQKGIELSQARGIAAQIIPTTDWFCDENQLCPAQIGPYIVRTDSLHITNAFAESLAILMRNRLTLLGIN
jgi:peptidoglycan/LPS O-acetylase OafA/YrhL